MATQAIRGRKCKIRLSSSAGTNGLIFNEVRNWSIQPTQEMIDASSADSSGWNEYIPGQRGFVFRAETVYAPQSNGSSGVGRDIAYVIRSLTANTGRGLTGFSVSPNADPVSGSTGGPGYWIAGTHSASTVRVASLTNFRVGGKYNDIQLFEFEITGSQALTYSTSSVVP